MLKLELVTLSGVKFQGEAFEVILPTPQGYIGVFANHAPLISQASRGIIRVRNKAADQDEYMEAFAVSGGIIEITDGFVRVLVDEADHSEEVDPAEAQKALARAQELKRNARERVELDQAQELIDRETTRLQLAQLRRRKQRP